MHVQFIQVLKSMRKQCIQLMCQDHLDALISLPLAAPLPKTVTHFWHLVWQEKPISILMLTNLVEGNKVKCHKYWPDSGSRSFGPFQITVTEQQMFANYTIRKFEVEVSVCLLCVSRKHAHVSGII